MTGTAVSVIIPYYRGESVIGDAIDSLRTQTSDNFEVVIVDDESPTDIPASVLDRLSDLHHHIVRLPKNVGTGAARNCGAALAEGSILTFLDQDDWLADDAVAEIAAGVRPRTAVAFDNRLAVRSSTGDMQYVGETVFDRAGWDRQILTPSEQALFVRSGFPMLKLGVSKSDFDRSGGYSAHTFGIEDYLFAWRLLSQGVSFRFHAPLGTHTLSAESTTAMISSSNSGHLRAHLSWLRVRGEIACSPRASASTRLTASRYFLGTVPSAVKAPIKMVLPPSLRTAWTANRRASD